MKWLAVAVLALMGALAPPAAADSIDGDPLTITADGKGRIQIVDADQGGVKLFSEPSPGISNAGLEIVEDGTYIPLNGNRTNQSGPTLTPPGTLTSVYDVGLDLRVTETMTYVDGENTVAVSYAVENLTADPHLIRVAEVADIGIGGDEFGRGFFHSGRSALGGVTQDGELAALVQTDEWDSFETGFFADVFNHFASGTLADRVDPRYLDNGVGAQLGTETLAGHGTATFGVRWLAGPDERVNTPDDGDDGACTTGAGGCTLREALTSASADGDIVTVPESQYALGAAGTLALTHSLTILGGGPRFTRIHGSGSGPVLSVPSAVTMDLRNVGVTEGEEGGIEGLDGSTILLEDVTVAGNSGTDGGGINAAGALDVNRSTISGNTAEGDGGGILLTAPDQVTLENSTLSGNTAGAFGGAIWSNDDLALTNVTVADNAAAEGGGLFLQVDNQKAGVTNSLFVRNTGGGCGGVSSAIESTNSLYDGRSCSFHTSTGDRFPADPRIGPLADHGGDTDTHAPQGGSDALDHGASASCPAIDQRGEPRLGGCDIGAMEGTETPGQLRVFTRVINDRDGTAVARSFATHVRVGATDVVASQTGSEAGRTFTVPGGTYRVAATGPAGYTLSYTGACAADGTFTMPAGGGRSCTVTAADAGGPRGTLRLDLRVVNDDGGHLSTGSFAVHVRGGGADVAGSPSSSFPRNYALDPGTYSISVVPPAGYTATVSASCSGTVTVVASATKTCLMFGDDIPPVPHEKVNVAAKSGTVKIKLPGASGFVTLGKSAQIPLGSVIDTRKGRVTLVAASDAQGGTVTADFFGGLFKVTQTKGKKPITQVALVEKLACKGAGKASAARKKKRKRRLWGDGHGRFRTKGSFSSATVRGTKWLVQDTCSTTTTKVKRGRVAVRDFVKGKTVLVKAGKTYVARRG
jgi:CSLREA domain-containing protein